MISKEDFEKLKAKEKILKEASNILRVEDKDLPRVIKRFLDEIKEMKSSILKDLNEKILNCKECELFKNRRNAVPGEGNLNAKIMFIGLGPGREEDIQGRPFVGAAGKFLNELLEMVGLKREDVYITNIVKCLPPNNQPSEESIKKCTSLYLDKQIEIIRPKIIVTLGEIATKYILEKFNIKYVSMNYHHGKIYKVRNLNTEIEIVCMFHPASALYNRELRDVIINDWKKWKEERLKEL